jgi:ABC-type Fe3+/spermidine/putrescine transport system ATPase subunit
MSPTLSQSNDASPAVSLRSVTKRYGSLLAVNDVSVEVARGEFLAIVGPSGSGKTTTMRLIGGFEAPDSGTVAVGGVDVTRVPAERRDVSTVFQSYALFPHLSVIDNVAFGPRMRGVARRERYARASQLLDLVRLHDVARRRPRELSGGMQQRVALARALANNPSVLLFDEPLGALDRKLRDEMQGELRRVQQELGSTFVYITHDQDEAFGMADRLAVMRDGEIVQIGDPAEVYDHPADGWIARFVGDANVVSGILRGTSPAVLDTDLGAIRGDRVVGLAAGDRGIALVRPEETRFEPAGRTDAAAAPGRIAARVVDVLTVGPRLQLRAETPGGIVFHSRVPRSQETVAAGVTPGDDIAVTFSAASVAFYSEEAPPAA